ncbi:sensor histidine kinase [Hyalangium rubrum]|uniref:histidine kinase n=1 Tax=Hyalangium rubrum TaxID=3103134 RepID=A0ABU5H2D5_9BACT|nr:ATP-binding protein [Hyalangium sp. s54d21]MDY7227618.1 ATP-binding protein [Hyalangium sp. s54d21]
MLHDSIDTTLVPTFPPEVLDEVKREGVLREFQPGEPLFTEGQHDYDFFVVLSGEVRVTRRLGSEDQVLAVHRPGAFTGEISLLSGGPAIATGRAVGETRVLQVKAEAFRRMVAECTPLARFVLQTLVTRRQDAEAQIRQQEKLAALGRMAAGLMHELNNPASAARRSAEQLREECLEAQHRALAHDERLSAPQREVLAELMRDLQSATPLQPLDALAQSDLEDGLLGWLESHGMANAFSRATTLGTAGVDLPHLEVLGATLEGEALEVGLTWLEKTLLLTQLTDVMDASTQRICSLIAAVRQYTYMDRDWLQEVDVHAGLEATLAMFAHRLRGGVTVTRDYDGHVPKLWAHGSELNQVWTNLIENALDAMKDQGNLRVSTRLCGDEVHVELSDDGPGVPEELQARVFEPFFTTKALGKGTGLGLDIALRIVERRLGGRIRLQSRPGDTCFRVELPLKPELPH